ncbi:hypothetical protein TIFTF001_010966 [Ficus carica]|uniref:Pentatricopeptide repeat-containing protein n=1 Tax=Ficus carica TaxID=3494 RepID=A0AA88D3U1_FICCA|nr:hypothetical protein TIFTF001_010966 [Ficus carica]
MKFKFILKPYESKFREPTLEAGCIVVQIATASKDLKMAPSSLDGIKMAIKAFNEYLLKVGVCLNTTSHIIIIHSLCELEGVKPHRRDENEKTKAIYKYIQRSVILLLCKTGKLSEAEKVLREMTTQGAIPDNVVCTILIDGFCKLGNVSAACRLFDEMRNRKIDADFLAYTTLIHGFCQAGKMVEADKLFDEMVTKGMKLRIKYPSYKV